MVNVVAGYILTSVFNLGSKEGAFLGYERCDMFLRPIDPLFVHVSRNLAIYLHKPNNCRLNPKLLYEVFSL